MNLLYISLTSSSNQFSEFQIFCLFTFLLIFCEIFFLRPRLERVIDGAADYWSYFDQAKNKINKILL